MPFLVTTYGIFRVGVSGHSKRILIAALLLVSEAEGVSYIQRGCHCSAQGASYPPGHISG